MHQTETNICDVLRRAIEEQLTPLIDSDYYYLDLPYHSNVGDTLIWLGTTHFLNNISHQCLGQHSIDTFDFRPLPKNTIILLHGGGNFGDIWRQHQEFRLKVMQQYPENPIIVLPQTVFYESDDVFNEDVRQMNRHQHLIICARDNNSAEQLRKHGYTGQMLTLPDMAFCIDRNILCDYKNSVTKETLLLLRKDKESPLGNLKKDFTSTHIDIKDWPDLNKSLRIALKYIKEHSANETDLFFQTEYLPERIKEGVKFISEYKDVYSTRLHVAILRLLLSMPVKMIDNSYGKNMNFYNTWLKDSELVSTPDENEQKAIKETIIAYRQELQHQKRRKRLRVVIYVLTILLLVMVFYFILFSV